jgi:hypothetical protein
MRDNQDNKPVLIKYRVQENTKKKNPRRIRVGIYVYDAAKRECFIQVLLFSGYAVAQLVEALRYKPKGRGFDSRWNHWNFSVT